MRVIYAARAVLYREITGHRPGGWYGAKLFQLRLPAAAAAAIPRAARVSISARATGHRRDRGDLFFGIGSVRLTFKGFGGDPFRHFDILPPHSCPVAVVLVRYFGRLFVLQIKQH